MQIQDKTVIVTGSSSGIGRALAVAFGKNGANVVCCARREDKLKETVQEVEKAGGRGLAVPTDITDQKQVKHMVETAQNYFTKIDILFNNAGSFSSIAPLWEAEPEKWWNDVTVNIYGAMLCTQSVLEDMKERNEGIIINMNGGRPVGGTSYAAGKAGLMEMSRLLVQELQAAGSRIIVLEAGPGLVDTAMTRLQAETEAGRKWIPGVGEKIDAGKTKKPEEIAEKTIQIIRIAHPGLSGTRYGPDTDIANIPRQ